MAEICIEVIFDNGGGINVQTDTYTHHYDDAEQAANDVKEILDGASTDGWEGNQPEFWIDTTSAEADEKFWGQVENGGYRHYDQQDLRSEMASTDPISNSWHNVSDFLVALTGRKVAE